MTATDALVEGHFFVSGSTTRGASISRTAGCECGRAFEWETRESEHARHLVDLAHLEGRVWAAADLRAEAERIEAAAADETDPTARTMVLVRAEHYRDAAEHLDPKD